MKGRTGHWSFGRWQKSSGETVGWELRYIAVSCFESQLISFDMIEVAKVATQRLVKKDSWLAGLLHYPSESNGKGISSIYR